MAVELNDVHGPRLSAAARVDALAAPAALAYAWLAFASHSPPVPLAGYLVAIGIAWISVIALLLVSRGRTEPLPMGRIVAWCLVFRAIGLVGAPILEDDFYRYLWDGRIFALTGNPYGTAPISYFDDPSTPLAFTRILDGINHPDVPTLYPPVVQLVFLLGYGVAPGELWPIKLVLIAADLATLALLVRMVAPRGVLLWAWCPLLVQETAFTAHPDVVGVSLCVAAWYAASRRHGAAAAAMLGLAVASKLFALLLLPFFATRLRARDWGLFVTTVAVVYGPFLYAGGAGDLAGLMVFAAQWEFNSTAYAVLADWIGRVAAKATGAVAVGLVTARAAFGPGAFRAAEGAGLPRGDLAFACLFLFAPVVNPWYLLWLLPFVCARPSAWGIAAMAAITLSYVHGLFLVGLAPYHHPAWVRPAELAVIAVALAIDARHRLSPSSRGPGFRRVLGRVGLGGPIVTQRSIVGVAAGAVLLFAVGLGGAAWGSGSYSGRPAHPGASIDRAQYEEGKKVFAGQFPRSGETGDAASQAEVLEALQDKLPLKARTRVSLTEYAGELDDEQLAALKYFLKKRYKVE